ncbi:SH3 domain-containing protein [Aquimarina aquimarini]|uniref:SH3 domain-containing protein n=1 Tax=Aquimarina aquimarini TaxID=1191734 RepID=UPI00131F2802|nr:SH3 domain-containing protein [Aquimarina aquimarini]
MWNVKCLFLLFLCARPICAQNIWVVSPTDLYEQPKEEGIVSGILLRDALVEIISENQEWAKVKVDNNMIGYVKKRFLVETLNARDQFTSPPPPIIDQNNQYGSPHLYTQVASLRGREQPSKNAKIGTVFTMGTIVRITFYPCDPEEWVNVGNYFVQQKYLGQKPSMKELYEEFDAIPKSDLKKRKQVGERLVEFSWKSGESKIPALERFLEIANQLKDEKQIYTAKLNLKLAKAGEDRVSFEKLHAMGVSESTYLVINGVKFSNYETLPLSKLIKVMGDPLKILKKEPDCCFSGDQRYQYSNAEFVVDQEKNIAEVDWISLQSDNNAFVINDFVINNKTTEEKFVDSVSKWVEYDGNYPEEYQFYLLEYALINISFKNRKPKRYSFSIFP